MAPPTDRNPLPLLTVPSRGQRKSQYISDLAFFLSKPGCRERLTRRGTKHWDAASSNFFNTTLKTAGQLQAWVLFWHEDEGEDAERNRKTHLKETSLESNAITATLNSRTLSSQPNPAPAPARALSPAEIVDIPSGAVTSGMRDFTADALDPSLSMFGTLHAMVSVGAAFQSYPNVMHGGAVATLLDEFLGMVTVWLRARGCPGFAGFGYMTGKLETEFLKPVPAPGVLVVSMRLASYEQGSNGKGAKAWVEGEIRAIDTDDGTVGEICAKGRTLWRTKREIAQGVKI